MILIAGVGRVEAGVIDTVAGTGKKEDVGQPFGVEIGPDGGLYVCEVENHRVLRVDRASGEVTTVAGTGKKGYAGDGGPAVKAEMNEPYEVRFDRAGNMYVVEMQNHVVRKVAAKTGVITTIAGSGVKGFGGDGGAAAKGMLNQPHSIAILEAPGNGQAGEAEAQALSEGAKRAGASRQNHVKFLYIADIGNHRIRRVDLGSGVMETVAGNGEKKVPVEGVMSGEKALIGPRALFVRGGTMWIALREGHSVWSMDLVSAKLTHVSGTGKAGYAGDGGPAKEAQYNGPKGIAVDAAGNVYVADTENQVIRRIDGKSGLVTTIAGSGPAGRGYGGDGGAATEGKMDRPHGVCVDEAGLVYIGDTNNHRVRRVRR
jgi:streptogramin lyase